MGHGTSCTNHAGPAGGGVGEKEDRNEQETQKLNLHCFPAGLFFLAKAAITDQLLPNSQFKKPSLWMKALAADFDHIPQLHQREREGE